MKNKKLNFIFWGTPDVASETLEILKENGYMPSLIITAPDKPSGRGLKIIPSPVSIWAEENYIDCLKPEKIDKEFISELNLPKARPLADQRQGLWQLSIVVAYGKIIPENIINLPKLGSINIHYSLLPKYRGASPVESSISNGDKETGITIQKMKYKMDTGPIIAQEKIEIEANETSPLLRKILIKSGGELLVKILPDFVNEKIKLIPQNEEDATYCKKIKKEDGLVNLETDLPDILYNKFRAYITWPRIFFFENEKRIIITDAELDNGKFIIKKIIPEGKKEINYKNIIK